MWNKLYHPAENKIFWLIIRLSVNVTVKILVRKIIIIRYFT